jgi:hypothetical protein
MGIKKGEFHADFESVEKVSELKITKNRQKRAVENNRMAVNGFRLPNSSFFPPSCLKYLVNLIVYTYNIIL